MTTKQIRENEKIGREMYDTMHECGFINQDGYFTIAGKYCTQEKTHGKTFNRFVDWSRSKLWLAVDSEYRDWVFMGPYEERFREAAFLTAELFGIELRRKSVAIEDDEWVEI